MKTPIKVVLLWGLIIPLLAGQNSRQPFYTFFVQQEYDSARSYLLHELERTPEAAPKLYFLLGRLESTCGRITQAVTAFEHALPQHPRPIEVHRALGQAYLEQNRVNDAIASFKHALKIDPASVIILQKLASLSLRQKDYPSAIHYSQAIILNDSTDIMGNSILGRALLKTLKIDEAIHYLSRAVEQDSAHFVTLTALAEAILQTPTPGQALPPLNRAEKISPKSGAVKYFLGQTYQALQQPEKAVACFRAASSLAGPYKIRAMRDLLALQNDLGNYDESLQIARHYFDAGYQQHESVMHYHFARALSETGAFKKSDAEFTKSLKTANLPYFLMIFFYQGLNAYEKGDYVKSIALYNKAIKIKPDFSHAWYNLAIACEDYYADKIPAIRYYEKFLKLADENREDPALMENARTRIAKLKESIFLNQ